MSAQQEFTTARDDVDGLLARAAQVTSALACDVMDGMGHRDGRFVGPEVASMSGEGHMVGRAFTMTATTVDEPPQEAYSHLLAAYEHMRPGDVVMIGVGTERSSGIWGELLSFAARARGVVGTVTDGLVRDVAQMGDLSYAVFAAGASPLDSYGRLEVTRHSVEITCGRAQVAPGDLVIADQMGVAVVPWDIAEDVVAQAEAKLNAETEVRTLLEAGDDPALVFERYGVL